jgi:hypothetical protein
MKEMTLEQKVQRALDYQEIQNVMSKHMYYHGAGLHKEELRKIWAQKTPGVTWTNQMGVWEGMDSIWQFYGEANEKRQKVNLEKISQLYPEVENKKENYGVGTLVTHTLTTAIIEVARDGKTAKGVWYSPGQVTEVGKDLKPMAMWMWEKYGVDFVKEDGEWKIWHIHMFYDFAVPPGTSWAEPQEAPTSDEGPEGQSLSDMPKPDKPSPDTYKRYSITTVPKLEPRLPEPYETFSETFSY